MHRLKFAALAAVFVLTASSSAWAAGINHSGQLRIGAANSAEGTGTFTYANWDPNLGTNSLSNSPHGNYTTSTVKCVVCHSVHYAAPGNGTISTATAEVGASGDTLLRMRARQACEYCHVTSGMGYHSPLYEGVPSTQILMSEYGADLGSNRVSASGGVSALGDPTPAAEAVMVPIYPFTSDTGHVTGDNCGLCHTSVHGAFVNGGVMDMSVRSLQGYMLGSVIATTSTGVVTNNMLEAITYINNRAMAQGFADGEALGYTRSQYATINSSALRESAVGIFCAECHLGSYAQAAAGAAASVNSDNWSDGNTLSGHRVGAAATSYWQHNQGEISSANTTDTQVAWAPTTNCRSCHASFDGYGNSAFPHSWGMDSAGNPTRMWLLAAPNLGATPSALPTDVPDAQLTDGVCLRCHRSAGDAAGVGITY